MRTTVVVWAGEFFRLIEVNANTEFCLCKKHFNRTVYYRPIKPTIHLDTIYKKKISNKLIANKWLRCRQELEIRRFAICVKRTCEKNISTIFKISESFMQYKSSRINSL